MSAEREFETRMTRLEDLLGQVERTLPSNSLDVVRELVQALLDVHQSGLKDLLDALGEARTKEALLPSLVARPAVASLLLMHDLHPTFLADRVQQAVDDALDIAGAQASAEIVHIESNRVLVRIRSEKPGAAVLLRKALERIACERAPDAIFDIDGGEPPPPSGFVPLERLHARSGGPVG